MRQRQAGHEKKAGCPREAGGTYTLKSHTLKVALLRNAGLPLVDLKTGKRCSSQGIMMIVECSFHEDLSL